MLELGHIEKRSLESMPTGICDVAVVEVDVVPVHDRAAGFGCESGRSCPTGIRQILSGGVTGLKLKALRESPVRRNRDRVIIASPAILVHSDAIQKGERN